MSDSINGKTVAKIITGLGLGTLIWEHSFRIYESDFRPSIGMKAATQAIQPLFMTIGSYLAQLSSYLHWLKFDELWTTIKDLSNNGFNLMTSPVHILKGYINKAFTYRGGPWMIYTGSFLMCAVLTYLVHKYHASIPIIRKIQPKTNQLINYLAQETGLSKEDIICKILGTGTFISFCLFLNYIRFPIN